MAAPWNPPVKNQDFKFAMFLRSYVNPENFLTNPTLAAGDIQVSKDGGSWTNVTTLGSVSPASGMQVLQELSSTEMNADIVSVRFKDQTVPPEWCEEVFSIITTAA